MSNKKIHKDTRIMPHSSRAAKATAIPAEGQFERDRYQFKRVDATDLIHDLINKIDLGSNQNT